MITPLVNIDQKNEKRKRIIAIAYICFGMLITTVMLTVAIWPGVLTYLLFPSLQWMTGENVFTIFFNILLAVAYFVLVIVLIIGIGLAPFIAIPIVVLIGIPSVIGGIGLLQRKRWAMKLLLGEAIVYLTIFPLGTLLGILTFILNKRERLLHKA